MLNIMNLIDPPSTDAPEPVPYDATPLSVTEPIVGDVEPEPKDNAFPNYYEDVGAPAPDMMIPATTAISGLGPILRSPITTMEIVLPDKPEDPDYIPDWATECNEIICMSVPHGHILVESDIQTKHVAVIEVKEIS